MQGSADAMRDLAARKEVVVYFLHVGQGQSIAIEVACNEWIVFDAMGHSDEQGTRAFLRHHMARPDFKIRALVVSHLHRDHYLGVPGIIEECETHARDTHKPLAAILEEILLPVSMDDFTKWLDSVEPAPKTGDLIRLREALIRARRSAVKTDALSPLRFAWPRTRPTCENLWLFVYLPDDDAIRQSWKRVASARSSSEPEALRRYLAHGARGDVSADPAFDLARENDCCYVLGLGYGQRSGDFHLLLTADVSASAFSRLTRDLEAKRLELATCVRKGGNPESSGRDKETLRVLRPFARYLPEKPKPEDRHVFEYAIHPLGGFSVPHHGSGREAIRLDDLAHWLRLRPGIPSRVFGVVQGLPRALDATFLESLADKDVRVFTSANPVTRLTGATLPSSRDGRLLLSPRQAPASKYRTVDTQSHDAASETSHGAPVPYLAITGGHSGVHKAYAKEFFEVDFAHRTVVHHCGRRVFFAGED